MGNTRARNVTLKKEATKPAAKNFLQESGFRRLKEAEGAPLARVMSFDEYVDN